MSRVTVSLPVAGRLVLVGGGHSHVEVLRRFGLDRLAGAQVSVIGRDRHTPYSGMLPGLIAGQYEFDDAHIDLARLCRFAGAAFRHDEAIGLDLDLGVVLCRAGPPVAFDVLSINIGSSPWLGNVPGAAEHAVAVKPIGRFLEAWTALCDRVMAGTGPVRIAVVGAGAGGVEMVLAMQVRLRALLAAAGRDDRRIGYTLIGQADHVLPGHEAAVRRRFTRVLRERSIRVITGQAIVAVENRVVRCADGGRHDFDEILFVTSAGAAPWLGSSGLALDARGFIKVDATLRSVSDERVFAAGDIATVVGHERPKSGVFAVRQGKPLAANLRRALAGETLRAFQPQRDALALIGTGDGSAVAARGRWSVEGRLVWRWKDWIDRRFMRRYQALPM
ncbi:FAD-dependent oxidoreductase [Acidiphilium sp.]|uniref:FAD-dependent oxidoreductase n=1 Tax=Acidiphilium sp. TaxID=527 RepID=UPI003CFFDFC9